MTLKSHNALWNANYAVLWLNGMSQVVGDNAVGHNDGEFLYRLSVVIISPCAAVWTQFWMQGFNLLVAARILEMVGLL